MWLLVISGFAAASASAAPAKPRSVEKASAPDAKLPAGTAAASAAPSTPQGKDPALKSVDLGALPQDKGALDTLKAKAATAGSVRVIVTLNTKFTPLNTLTSDAAASQKSTVSGLSDDVVSLASAHGGKVTRTYGGNIPAVALTATPGTLDALADDPSVAKIDLDGSTGHRTWTRPADRRR